ncbi:MAG: hypothetical protein HYT72_05635 [Candidatus Aenigmarchaeota archaeon]|nr:hypothetical protein [Candidatus Aenigmarchaeota archaeon]
MKGQYRLVSEVLLFAAGVAMASFVIVSFTSVKDAISKGSVSDQLVSVSNLITTSLVKVSQNNAVLRIKIPGAISGKGYRIRAVDGNGNPCEKGKDCFLNLSIDGESYARQVFNISQNYKITGDIPSTVTYIEIVSANDEIRIQRGA